MTTVTAAVATITALESFGCFKSARAEPQSSVEADTITMMATRAATGTCETQGLARPRSRALVATPWASAKQAGRCGKRHLGSEDSALAPHERPIIRRRARNQGVCTTPRGPPMTSRRAPRHAFDCRQASGTSGCRSPLRGQCQSSQYSFALHAVRVVAMRAYLRPNAAPLDFARERRYGAAGAHIVSHRALHDLHLRTGPTSL